MNAAFPFCTIMFNNLNKLKKKKKITLFQQRNSGSSYKHTLQCALFLPRLNQSMHRNFTE